MVNTRFIPTPSLRTLRTIPRLKVIPTKSPSTNNSNSSNITDNKATRSRLISILTRFINTTRILTTNHKRTNNSSNKLVNSPMSTSILHLNNSTSNRNNIKFQFNHNINNLLHNNNNNNTNPQFSRIKFPITNQQLRLRNPRSTRQSNYNNTSSNNPSNTSNNNP